MKYVRLHLDEHVSVRQIEREHGIRNSLVLEWGKRYLQDEEESLEPRNGNHYAALYRSKSLSEVGRLRAVGSKARSRDRPVKKTYWVEGVGANKEYVTGCGKTTKFSKNSK